jgi:hypothetical protein
MKCETSSSIQERTYRAYSGEDTLALLDGVPGVRTTLRGQEDSLRSRVPPTPWEIWSSASLTEKMTVIVIVGVAVIVGVILVVGVKVWWKLK